MLDNTLCQTTAKVTNTKEKGHTYCTSTQTHLRLTQYTLRSQRKRDRKRESRIQTTGRRAARQPDSQSLDSWVSVTNIKGKINEVMSWKKWDRMWMYVCERENEWKRERGCCPNLPLTAIITCGRSQGVRFSVSDYRAGEFHRLAAVQSHSNVFHSGCVCFTHVSLTNTASLKPL